MSGATYPSSSNSTRLRESFSRELQALESSPSDLRDLRKDFILSARVGDIVTQFKSLQHAAVIVGGLVYQTLGDHYTVELKSMFGTDLRARALLSDRKRFTRYVLEITGDVQAERLFVELGLITNKETCEAVSIKKSSCDIDGLLRIVGKLKQMVDGAKI